jgi:hypothetical protein
VQDAVFQVLEAVLPRRELKHDRAGALHDPGGDSLLGHGWRTLRDASTRDADAGAAVERLGIRRLHVVSMQRPAREVDDDAEEGGVVTDPDVGGGQRRRGGSGRDLRNRKGQHRDEQKPFHRAQESTSHAQAQGTSIKS